MFDKEMYKETFSSLHASDDTLMKVYKMTKEKANRPRMRMAKQGVLIAATIILLTMSAMAVVISEIRMHHAEEGEAVSGTVSVIDPDGNILEQSLSHSDVSLVLDFDIQGISNEVYFKPGWLPSEFTYAISPDGNDWLTYAISEGEESISYCAEIYSGARLDGMEYFFTGNTTVVNEDQWYDWQRIEISSDYSTSSGDVRTVNYLLLFSSENGYMIYIAGEEDCGGNFAVLEEIAKNLEIKVSEEPAQAQSDGTDIGCLDLGRG